MSVEPRTRRSTDLALIEWSSRVNPRLITRLYELNATGIHDDELVDDVGYALWARCRSILEIAAANEGDFTCPRCAIAWSEGARWDRSGNAVVRCPGCSWSVTWREFKATYQHKHFGTGGVGDFHREFIERFPACRTYVEKLLAIDRLIHCFHWELIGTPGRPGARELIYAKNNVELLTFLDRLTYGEGSAPELCSRRKAWRRTLETNRWLNMTGFAPRPMSRSSD